MKWLIHWFRLLARIDILDEVGRAIVGVIVTIVGFFIALLAVVWACFAWPLLTIPVVAYLGYLVVRGVIFTLTGDLPPAWREQREHEESK